MADIQSFVTFHTMEPIGPYSPTYACHAPCDTPLMPVTDGAATLAYCPKCKLPDMQAMGALLAAFEWLRANTPQDIDGELCLNEYEENGPGDRPPLDVEALRVWSFAWGFTLDASDDEGDDHDLIIALLPDGGYHIVTNDFETCGHLGIDPLCAKFVSRNDQGVLACPEHGALNA
jgi:hypothetical protein